MDSRYDLKLLRFGEVSQQGIDLCVGGGNRQTRCDRLPTLANQDST